MGGAWPDGVAVRSILDSRKRLVLIQPCRPLLPAEQAYHQVPVGA